MSPVATAPQPASGRQAIRTSRDYLSYTQLKTFQACPLRWHFEYVEQLEAEQVSGSLVFGGAIHAAIEAFYTTQLEGESSGLDSLLQRYDEAWEQAGSTPITLARGESTAALRRLAENLLLAYLERDEPDGRILGVEETLRGALIPAAPDLLARIDLIVQRDAALLIRDFKTARSRWNQAQLRLAAPQLLLYAALAQPLALQLGLPLRLEFVVLTKTSSPLIETLEVEFDPSRLARTLRIAGSVWSTMSSGRVYPSPSALNCPACPFQRACRKRCG